MPNSTFIVRQVWMAASLRSDCRPRLPVGAASQVRAESNQIADRPRHFGASWQAGQFPSPQAEGVGSLTQPGYRAGFTS